MADLFSMLREKYQNDVSAEALFFNAAGKACRVECPKLGKEFNDCVDIGKGESRLLAHS
jgi:hypothetical protein